MKRPTNFDELLFKAQHSPDLVNALYANGIHIKRIGSGKTSRGSVRFGTTSRSGIEGDLSSVAFYHNPDGTWFIVDHKARNGNAYMDAIGAMREFCNMSFDEAVYVLSGNMPSMREYSPVIMPKETDEATVEASGQVVLPPQTKLCVKQVIAYLTSGRNIPYDAVAALLRKDLLYSSFYSPLPENEKKPFAIFPVKNNDNENVGAEIVRASTYVRFKQLAAYSDANYAWGFRYDIEKIESNTPLFFCESAIDAISLCCIAKDPGVYLSMAGLKDVTLQSVTKQLGGTPVLCVDNDEAGEKFRLRNSTGKFIVPGGGKDWNEILQKSGGKYAVRSDIRFGAIQPIYTKAKKTHNLCI